MLEHELRKMEWDYNFPKTAVYGVNESETCPICKNTILREWIAPLICAKVEYNRINYLTEKYFNFTTTPEMIDVHAKHITVKFEYNKDVEDKAKEQMRLIESDLVIKIDEKAIIESTLRSLTARKLFLENEGNYGKEYRDIIYQLHRWTELKLKSKGELVDQTMRVTLDDLISVNVGGNKDESQPVTEQPRLPDAPAIRPDIVRDGSRESIEEITRAYKDFYQQRHSQAGGSSFPN